MTCQSCGAENPSQAKFCGSCGNALAVVCAACGNRNAPGTRFCNECGGKLVEVDVGAPVTYVPENLAEKIRAGRTELEGERKLITVLFADVVGFTRLSSELDPEETHATMRRCFDLMLAEIHRYEGTVSQFLGDGMLALFGAPIAHEDHAQRATHSGLAIQSALQEYRAELQAVQGIEFSVRIGLNSGPVVVSRVGVDLTMDYLAVGDTVNLASRMQSLAEPGTVVVSEHTQRLVDGYFVTRDLGRREVKGKTEPIGVFEVVRPRRSASRVDVSAERGLAPFVGRNRQLRALVDRFEGATASSGQVIFVVGEAGVGKSRLVHEFRNSISADDVAWIVGRCLSYGRDIPYVPLIDLLKDAFGVDETDSEQLVAAKVEARAPQAGAPYIRHLLGVGATDSGIAELDAQIRKARTFDALVEFLTTAATERTHVVVIEDLHWMDHASAEFLSFFVDAIKTLPIMLILTHRPDWESPLGTRPYFTRLDLQNLSEEDSAAIGAGVAGGTLPADVERLIFGKAEGNPFFVEEVTRSLVEMGALRRDNGGYELARPIDEIEVPNTVQGVIMARLDRLDEDPRRALQTASVIGREFTVRLLDKISALPSKADAHLRELRALELIYERSLYPELQYMFKHALTHDVAYSSLLIARRKALHAVVASAIEELYADRLAEHYEMIAFHAEQGENWPLAFEYLVRSADKALQAFAPGSTHEFCQRALAIADRGDVEPSPEQLLHVHSSDGQALYLVSRFVDSAAAFGAAEEIAQELGDELAEGVALFQRAMSLHWGHRFDEAMDAAERARAIGVAHGNDAVLAGSLMTIEGVYAVRGDQEAVTSVMREASEVAVRSQVPLLEGVTAVWEGFVHHWRGEEQRALEIWGRGEQVAREHQLAIVQLWTFWNRALALIGTGAYDEALASLHEHLTLTERLGERAFRCRTLNTLGWLHIDLCDWERAIEYNRQGSELSRQVGDPEIIRNAEINLGECFLRIGDLDEAQRCLTQVEREAATAAAWGEEWMKWRYMQHLHVVLSELWLARRDADRALEYAEKCIQQAEATSSPRNVAKGRRARANALAALGRDAEARVDLDISLAAAQEVGTPAQIWQTLEALGRPSDALAVLDDMAAGLADDHLRTTLLGSAEYARVRAAAEQ